MYSIESMHENNEILVGINLDYLTRALKCGRLQSFAVYPVLGTRCLVPQNFFWASLDHYSVFPPKETLRGTCSTSF